MKIHPGSKLVMIGDSITDCGRARPIAEAPGDALGSGYVSLVDAFLMATYPQHGIRVVNTGIGGDTVRDLKARWRTDVLDLKPDWLSIKIGINDVWRHFDRDFVPGGLISQEEYEQTLDELVRSTLPGLKGLILMTPYFIEPNREDPMRVMMDRYREVVRRLAGKYQVTLVDTQVAIDQVLKDVPPIFLAEDRVHPNLAGHMVLARAFLKEIDYTW
jgi:lysophospholipase L1-like esterase